MAEYIKRDAAFKALCQVAAPTPSESYIVEKCIDKINRLPMIELVRCKDCQFSKYFEESGTRKCRTQGGLYRTVQDDDFCSYGERREGE